MGWKSWKLWLVLPLCWLVFLGLGCIPGATPGEEFQEEALRRIKSATTFQAAVEWKGEPKPTKLVIEYTVRNVSDGIITYIFRSSGQLCGEVRNSEGKEILKFPEVTAQALSRVKIEPGKTHTFRHEIFRKELAGASAGRYELSVSLCSQKGRSFTHRFDLPPEA